MNNAERITALEGLLVRIQKNAAAPRSAQAAVVVRAANASHAATPVSGTAVTPKRVVPPAEAKVERPKVPQHASKTDPGMNAAALALEATAALEEMDDPLAFDFGDEPTTVAPLPKSTPVLKAPTITAPMKAPVLTAPMKAPVVLPPLKAPVVPPPPVLADDIDIAFEDEVTQESPLAAAGRVEAETERLAAEKASAEAARLAAEKAEADRRAEEWRLLEEEAVHLEAEQIARDQAEALAQEADAKAEAARVAAAAAEKANAERLAQEAAEASRLAKAAAAQAEAERLKAARLAEEAAAKAKAEAQRVAAEEAAAKAKAEAERVAAAEAAAKAKAEAERVAAAEAAAKAKAEAERLAAEEQRLARATAEQREREAAAEAEAEREASERAEAERQAQIEAQQLAEEQAAAAKQALVEAAPPASARQPRDESRFDEMTALDEDDVSPVSGQVQSQRQPTIHDELTVPAGVVLTDDWGDDEPTFVPAAALIAAQADEERRIAGKSPITPIDVAPEITSRPATAADAVSFLGAVRAASPASFGALLDDSLALGA